MSLHLTVLLRLVLCRVSSCSETESEAGDLLEQQFEELNNKLSSGTDPTGYLRMVSRNNLFNRSGSDTAIIQGVLLGPFRSLITCCSQPG